MKITEFFTTLVTAIIFLYVLFAIITQLSKQTPEFSFYGWAVFILSIFGIFAFVFNELRKK